MGPGCLLLAKRSGLEMDSQMERPSGLSLGLGEAAAALGSAFLTLEWFSAPSMLIAYSSWAPSALSGWTPKRRADRQKHKPGGSKCKHLKTQMQIPFSCLPRKHTDNFNMQSPAKAPQWGGLHNQSSLGYDTDNKHPVHVPGALRLANYSHNHPLT